MQPIFLLLSLYERLCRGQHARSYFWDIWFKIMRKPTQAVRWMERTSEQVVGSTQAQWGGGQFLELGGRVCFPGDSALPSWEDTYCSGICWARGDQKELSRKASMPAAQQRREFPLLSNDLHWMNMSSRYKALLLHDCSQDLQEGNCTNIAENNQTVRDSKEGTMNRSVISTDTLSREKVKAQGSAMQVDFLLLELEYVLPFLKR